MSAKFEHGKSYPIETLPDDGDDEMIPNRDRWSLKTILLWNECQGWWVERAWQYQLHAIFHGHVARFWSPMLPDPMTRDEILAERGQVVCPTCDYAISPNEKHTCPEHAVALVAKQSMLQTIADEKV